jgi:hypothetical protein
LLTSTQLLSAADDCAQAGKLNANPSSVQPSSRIILVSFLRTAIGSEGDYIQSVMSPYCD